MEVASQFDDLNSQLINQPARGLQNSKKSQNTGL
jgi:hypothetical protein